MRKLLSICLLFILISFVGCSKQEKTDIQDYSRPIDIISVEPLMTCTLDGNEECLVAIKNYTNNTVDNYSVEILSKDKKEFITGMSFNEMIDPNGTVKVSVVLPNGLTYDDVVLNISDYNFQE